jgi:hypothetical protein
MYRQLQNNKNITKNYLTKDKKTFKLMIINISALFKIE